MLTARKSEGVRKRTILEIIENYKLRIPPTVYYDLKADIVNFEEPTTKNDLAVSSRLEKNSKKLEKNFGELDCISRAEAIKCLECDFDITGKENMKTVVNYINSAHDKIVNLPRVKQEPKSGHWIKHETPNSTYYDCSHCGCVAPCTEFADSYLWKLSNFCPDCGRRMEGIISYFPSTEVEE